GPCGLEVRLVAGTAPRVDARARRRRHRGLRGRPPVALGRYRRAGARLVLALWAHVGPLDLRRPSRPGWWRDRSKYVASFARARQAAVVFLEARPRFLDDAAFSGQALPSPAMVGTEIEPPDEVHLDLRFSGYDSIRPKQGRLPERISAAANTLRSN